MLWNQRVGIDCSLSHPAGHKPFTCSHCVCMYHVTQQSRLVLDAFFCSHICACVYDLAESCMGSFSRVVSRASCCLTHRSTVFCDIFVSSSWQRQVAVCANGRQMLPLCVIKCDARVDGNKLYNVTSQTPLPAPLKAILSRSEGPSGKCAKLRTVAASNNRVHMP